MRFLVCLLLLAVAGCGRPIAGATEKQPRSDAVRQAVVLAEPSPPLAPAADAPLSTRKTGDDWPKFLGPNGNSVSNEKGIIAPWPREGLRIVWQKRTGVGYGMPSISQGRLFQFDKHERQARLACLNAETGEFIWQFEYPSEYEDQYGYDAGPRCCPVVDGDRVYINGVEGMLHCVRVSDGKLLWKVDTKAEFGFVQNFFGVGSTPVVEGDLLIAMIGGSPKGSDDVAVQLLKGNGSGIVAFDKLTGKVRYRITDELASYASPVLATIKDRRYCFVFARGGLVGFEPKSGKVDFHYPWRSRLLESVNASNPMVIDDQVFISETYGPGSALLKVKPGGVEEVWTDANKRRDKSMQCHWNTPIYHDGYLYGCSGRHTRDGELRCIELATGKVMWSETDLTRTSLLMVDDHFVCLGEDGTLLLLKVNPRKYEEVSRLELRDASSGQPVLRYPCWAAPILSHGLLYVRGRDRLVCFELIPEKR
jgi:outer membrane protein assembly factor BamB